MTIEQRRLTWLLLDAVAAFNVRKLFLIREDLSERCVCAKFASYLERRIAISEYSAYDVDVEYNRGYAGSDASAKRAKNSNKLIIPDLIVHKRGWREPIGYDNLICIEMKKSGRRADALASDEDRLADLTNEAGGYYYRAGYLLLIERGKAREDCRLALAACFFGGMREEPEDVLALGTLLG